MMSNRKSLSKSLGELKYWNKQSFGIEAETEEVKFKLLIYNHKIIRVHISQYSDYDDQSYAVIAKPESVKFSIEENDLTIILKTDKVTVHVTKNPVRFSFYDHNENLLNKDDEGFGTSLIGEQITTYKEMQDGERFIGLGEKTGPLDRKGNGYEHWNLDNFAYGSNSDPLYCSTPFYIGLHNELQYGIYFDNSHKTLFNFGASNDRFSSFSADTGDMNYYFIYDENVARIIEQYTHLTGRMDLPPLWSIGYQQCRYSYYPEHEVTTVAKTFRDKDIPADVIVFDIHYMDKYKIFTWDKERFPDPKGMIDKLKEMGFEVVVMCDPGIKKEKGYAPYESGIKENIFLKYPDGEPYSGEVWPGWCHFPDFTKEQTRDWWKENLKSYTDIGVSGYWNDMNEIATWGHKLPELIEFDFEGEKATTRKGRNIYGLQMAKSTYEGTKSLLGKRPFNLTRSGFSGIQRYAAVWTGDNVASDEHMLLGVRLVNSMGLTGISFAGYDVGGFAGNASEHLFARWVQIGAFSPFFRGHSMINSRDSEPWAYGEEVEEISRNYIALRYRMMAYIYSLFYESTITGLPVVRSLAIDYTHDNNIYDHAFHNQYLFGPSILVAPVESYKDLVKVYLPKGDWYNFYTDKLETGGKVIISECDIEQLPLFVKESAIIPFYPDAHTNTSQKGEVLELHIYHGKKSNSFTLYQDDGASYNYENGEYEKRSISYEAKNNTIKISAAEGNYESSIKELKLILHGFEEDSYNVKGESIQADNEEYQFVDPISKFDPVSSEGEHRLKIKSIKSISLKYDGEAIGITW